jgi:hypothetical protein
MKRFAAALLASLAVLSLIYGDVATGQASSQSVIGEMAMESADPDMGWTDSVLRINKLVRADDQAVKTKSALHVQSRVEASAKPWQWNITSVLDNFAAASENVSVYAKANKYGAGSTWAMVSQADCFFARGGCFAHEFDLTVFGETQPGDLRIGILSAIWGAGKAHYGMLLTSAPWREDDVRVDHGVAVELLCDIACVSVRQGQKIALDSEGRVAIRSSGDGSFEVMYHSKPTFQFDARTGELKIHGRKVKLEFE